MRSEKDVEHEGDIDSNSDLRLNWKSEESQSTALLRSAGILRRIQEETWCHSTSRERSPVKSMDLYVNTNKKSLCVLSKKEPSPLLVASL